MTDVPVELHNILAKNADDVRHNVRELMLKLLDEETKDEPDTVEVTITFKVTREDWNQYRADNLTHLQMNRHEALVSMIQENLYDGGPLEYGDFTVA